MTDESRVRDRAFELWEMKGRQPGVLNECLEQAREECALEALRDAKAEDAATAPPGLKTKPGRLFQGREETQPPIDRRGRDITTDEEQPLIRTETQGVPQD
ncbi:hypothetical protein [Niveispirillum fermenti]|uniref:hypothetical protein n=1 Tax=Niveispirillum fermenti TaxID=1233113 RepID=UPI003A86A30C